MFLVYDKHSLVSIDKEYYYYYYYYYVYTCTCTLNNICLLRFFPLFELNPTSLSSSNILQKETTNGTMQRVGREVGEGERERERERDREREREREEGTERGRAREKGEREREGGRNKESDATHID